VQIRIGSSDVLNVEQIIPAQGITHVCDDLERFIVIVEDLAESGEQELERLPIAPNAPKGPVQRIQFSGKS